MQVRKVAAVATGALATAAVMGSTPAFAADSQGGAVQVAPAIAGVSEYAGKHRASDEEMRQRAEQWLTPEQGSVIYQPQPLLSIGSGSVISVDPTQDCGSNFNPGYVGFGSPNVVKGDCDNGNILIEDNGQRALISILDRTAISLFPTQTCGSDFGYNGLPSFGSPNAVLGDCSNGNIAIVSDFNPHHKKKHKKRHYYESGAEATAEGGSSKNEQQVVYRPQSLLSVGSGSAVSLDATQVCGSGQGSIYPPDFIPLPPVVPPPVDLPEPIDPPVGDGVVAEQFGFGGGNLVKGDCDNGNILIQGQGGGALISALDGTAISISPTQACGSDVSGLDFSGSGLSLEDLLDLLGDAADALLPIIEDLLPIIGDLLPIGAADALPLAESQNQPQTEQFGFGFNGNLVKGDCSNGNIAIMD
jgi:hypothetical protein